MRAIARAALPGELRFSHCLFNRPARRLLIFLVFFFGLPVFSHVSLETRLILINNASAMERYNHNNDSLKSNKFRTSSNIYFSIFKQKSVSTIARISNMYCCCLRN